MFNKNIIIIGLVIILLLVAIYYIKNNSKENLYTENIYETLEEQQIKLDELQNQYDNGVPIEDQLVDHIDDRDKLLYTMTF
jgi:hypothetical protein